MAAAVNNPLMPDDLSKNYNKNQSEPNEKESYLILKRKDIGTDPSYKPEIVWRNVVGFAILHVLGLYGILLLFTGQISFKTAIWTLIYMYLGVEGITMGAHRLFTHKSFKAKPLLKACLLIMHTIAGQNSMFVWCRDHRLHHRYSDTDGDPHNANRGFFFSHMGWLMSKKHPYVTELGRQIDISDLKADWMVMLQKKYYLPLYLIFSIFIPVWVPVHYFNESWLNSICICYFARYIVSLHGTWTVNSLAHIYGPRPYDGTIKPAESWFVAIISLGEGWHNYHHAFPWDYNTAELTSKFNFTSKLCRFFERMGLVSELKTASPELVKNRIIRSGDGTHFENEGSKDL